MFDVQAGLLIGGARRGVGDRRQRAARAVGGQVPAGVDVVLPARAGLRVEQAVGCVLPVAGRAGRHGGPVDVLAGSGRRPVQEGSDAPHRLDRLDAVGGEPVVAAHDVPAQLAQPLLGPDAGDPGLGVGVQPGLRRGPRPPGVGDAGLVAQSRVEHRRPLRACRSQRRAVRCWRTWAIASAAIVASETYCTTLLLAWPTGSSACSFMDPRPERVRLLARDRQAFSEPACVARLRPAARWSRPSWTLIRRAGRCCGRLLHVGVQRVVPDLLSRSLEDAQGFYARVLGLEPVMDHGWIVTLADPGRPGAQISLMTHDETAAVVPTVSVQVDDADAAYAAAVREGAEIVHPLTKEPWGVRRFFVRDPDGNVINVLGHR